MSYLKALGFPDHQIDCRHPDISEWIRTDKADWSLVRPNEWELRELLECPKCGMQVYDQDNLLDTKFAESKHLLLTPEEAVSLFKVGKQ